jgi:hypothetical protein
MERRWENQSHVMISISVSTGNVHENKKYPIYFIPEHGSCLEYPDECVLFNEAAMFRYTKNGTPVVQRWHNAAVLYILITTSR